jgi:hypothetical protein
MFLNKKTKQQELFDDYIMVKKGINRYNTQLAELDEFAQDYHEKSKAIEEKLSGLFDVLELIESNFLRDNGDIYVGTGYEVKDLREEPTLVPVYIRSKDRAGHTSVQGTTRMGKSVFMLYANIQQNLKAKENTIVLDPKGGEGQEVFSGMVEFAYESDMLYFFKYYSLAYPELSDKLNPFFGMEHEERANLMAAISAIGNSEQFFSDVVYQLTYTVSLCFEVIEMSVDPYGKRTEALINAEQHRIEKFRKNKGFMRDYIHKEKELSSPDQIDLSFADMKPEEIKALNNNNSTLMTFRDLAKFVSYSSIEGLSGTLAGANLENVEDLEIKSRFTALKDSAKLEIDKILEQPKEFYTKISISLATLLTQMSQGAMGEIFCSCRINPMLSDLSDPEKRLVALIHPYPLRYKKISDMSSRVFLITIENMLGRVGSTGRGFNAKVNVHVDEAASVAYPGIERLPAMAGGLGVNLYFYTQSFANWVKALGSQEAAEEMLDNLNNQVRFRMKDEGSAERVVRELGYSNVISSSAMIEGDGSARMMMAQDQRWFAQNNDILKMAVGRIIITTGKKTYTVDTPFWQGPKGAITMPEINIEKRVKNIKAYETKMNSLVDSMASIHQPENFTVDVVRDHSVRIRGNKGEANVATH